MLFHFTSNGLISLHKTYHRTLYDNDCHRTYRQASNISRIKHQNWMFLVSLCSCLCPIHWSQVGREWRHLFANYIWVINNFITHQDVPCIRGLTVCLYTHKWHFIPIHRRPVSKDNGRYTWTAVLWKQSYGIFSMVSWFPWLRACGGFILILW